MISICCTPALRERPDVHVGEETPLSTSRLGNWYGDVVRLSHRPLILMVSEPSRLALLLPSIGAIPLEEKMRHVLSVTLKRLAVPDRIIDRELSAMNDVRFCNTPSQGTAGGRAVLDTIVDYGSLLDRAAPLAMDLYDVGLRLSEIPCSGLHGRFPVAVACTVLAEKSPCLRLVH